MKKGYKHLIFCLLAAGFMLGTSAVASAIPACAGFFVSVLLFLFVDPLFTLGIGIAAGFDLRHFWYAPLLTALLYWLGTGLFITWSMDSLFYVLVYMVIGTGAMLLTHFIRYSRRSH